MAALNQSTRTPANAVLFIFTLLCRMEFKVGTGHGISTNSYDGANDNPSNPGQGSGQGQGSGPMLYGASSDVTLTTYNHHCIGAIFQHPSNREPPREDHVSQFVDDATQFVNTDGIKHSNHSDLNPNLCQHDPMIDGMSPLTLITNNNSQKWSAYNWSSGGKLNYDKCFWYLLHLILKGRRYCLASKDDIKGELDVMDPSDGHIM